MTTETSRDFVRMVGYLHGAASMISLPAYYLSQLSHPPGCEEFVNTVKSCTDAKLSDAFDRLGIILPTIFGYSPFSPTISMEEAKNWSVKECEDYVNVTYRNVTAYFMVMTLVCAVAYNCLWPKEEEFDYRKLRVVNGNLSRQSNSQEIREIRANLERMGIALDDETFVLLSGSSTSASTSSSD